MGVLPNFAFQSLKMSPHHPRVSPFIITIAIFSINLTVKGAIIPDTSLKTSKTSIQSQEPLKVIINSEVDRNKCLQVCPSQAEQACKNSNFTLTRCNGSRPIEWTVLNSQEGIYSVLRENFKENENVSDRKLYQLDICIYSNSIAENDNTKYVCKYADSLSSSATNEAGPIRATADASIELHGILDYWNWTSASCHSGTGHENQHLQGPLFLPCRNVVECGNKLNFLQEGTPFPEDVEASISKYKNLYQLYNKTRGNLDYGNGVAICRTHDLKRYRFWAVFLSLNDARITFPVTYGFPSLRTDYDPQLHSMRLERVYKNNTGIPADDSREIKIGQVVRFKCLVSSYFFMTGVQWRVVAAGKKVDPKDYKIEPERVNEGIGFVASTLNITMTEDLKLNKLEVTCTAKRWGSLETNETSLELSKPLIHNLPREVTLSGDTVTVLTCVASGNPCPEIEWYFNGTALDRSKISRCNDSGCEITEKGFNKSNSLVVNGSLNNVHHLKGKFACSAKNAFGTTTGEFEAKVKSLTPDSSLLPVMVMVPTTVIFVTIIAILGGVIWNYRKERIPAKRLKEIYEGLERTPYFLSKFEVPYLSWIIDKKYEVPASRFSIDKNSQLGAGSMAIVREATIFPHDKTQDSARNFTPAPQKACTKDAEEQVALKIEEVQEKVVPRKVAVKMMLHWAMNIRLEFIYEIKHWVQIGNFEHRYKKYIAEFFGYHVTENADKIFIFMERYAQDLQTFFVGDKKKAKNITPVDDLNRSSVDNSGYKQWAPAGSAQVFVTDLLRLALQISKGLECLADLEIVHGDLAPRNILLTNSKKPDARITDFGLSKSYGVALKIEDRSQIFVRPPESCGENPAPPSEKWDVWGYGILLWEMFEFSHKTPYQAENLLDPDDLDQSFENIVKFVKEDRNNRLQKPDFCPAEIYHIMLQCWDLNPERRPNFKKITRQLEEFAQSCGVMEAMRDLQ